MSSSGNIISFLYKLCWERGFAFSPPPNQSLLLKPHSTPYHSHRLSPGTPRLTGTGTITISVIDTNDNVPSFSAKEPYDFSILDQSPPGSTVGAVTATDPDQGLNAKLR
jgi:hypothetical protein